MWRIQTIRQCNGIGLFAGLLLAAVTLAGALSPSHAASYADALKACRANAAKATDLPTGYACDWPQLIKGAHGAALSGRYDARARYFVGTLTIIEGGGPALVGIEATMKSNTRQCTVQATGTRDANDLLVVRANEAAGCSVRIRSSGLDRVRVTAQGCNDFCGMGATFEGEYKLQRR